MEAIGTLAGGIAHDFNNILAGILGELSVLDFALEGDDKSHACIQDVVGAGGLRLRPHEAASCTCHSHSVRCQATRFRRVVAKTSMMFGRTRKEIEIRLDLPPGLLAVLMDRTQIEQILLNLFVNAAQAHASGWSALTACKERGARRLGTWLGLELR